MNTKTMAELDCLEASARLALARLTEAVVGGYPPDACADICEETRATVDAFMSRMCSEIAKMRDKSDA